MWHSLRFPCLHLWSAPLWFCVAVVWLCTGRVVFLLFSSVACVVALVVRSSSKQFAVEVSCVGGADVVLCGLSVVAMLCRGRCMQRFQLATSNWHSGVAFVCSNPAVATSSFRRMLDLAWARIPWLTPRVFFVNGHSIVYRAHGWLFMLDPFI